MKAVGIDLGTTYSAVAWLTDSGRTAMIPDSRGEILTPSVVLFEDDEVIVGQDAKRAALLKIGRVADTVKRDVGNAVYSRPIRGEYLPPEVIQACILRKLRGDIARELGPGDHRVVITVPAFFDEPRRRSTAQAGEMAGLALLDIVNEPTAAALAFGEQFGYLTPLGAPRERQTLLVYDLGGGTFDVTLVEIGPGEFRTIATDGDVRLGGRDWDLRLANFAAEAFIKEHREDPRQNPASMEKLLVHAEAAKHALSEQSQALVHVEHAGSSREVAVTRDDFETMTADLLERTAFTTRQLLAAASRSWQQVDRILLVGGATRMPMVAKMLEQASGKPPDMVMNPDEAVARGAALYAHYLLATRGEVAASPGFSVTNVNSHSLGIEGIDQETGRKRNVVLIPRNTPLPARKARQFVTKADGQPTIEIAVLEGESPLPEACAQIGRTVIRDLPHLPKGWPIEVVYEYAANGRLSIKAKVRRIDREVFLELERAATLPDGRVQQWKRVLDRSPGFPAFEAMLEETLRSAGLIERGAGSKPAGPAAAGVSATTLPASPIPLAGRKTAGESLLPEPAFTEPATSATSMDPYSAPPGTPYAAAYPGQPPLAQFVASPRQGSAPPGAAAVSGVPMAQLVGSPPGVAAAAASHSPVPSQPLPSQPSLVASPVTSEGVGSMSARRPRSGGSLGGLGALVGHILFSAIGLALGYYLLCCVAPSRFNFLNLPVPTFGSAPEAEEERDGE